MRDDFENIEESPIVELKCASEGLPKSLWESYSAFSNTSGGTIYLGIIEKKKPEKNLVVGVKNAQQMIKDLFATARNKEKVSRSYLREEDVQDIETEGRHIVKIAVREAPRTSKPIFLNGSIDLSYVRNHEGDSLADRDEIRAMLMDNGDESYDLLPNSQNYSFSDVNLPTLRRYRANLDAAKPNNIYRSYSESDFLKAIGCLTINNEGRPVLTNAAVMMFASNPLIMTMFPHFLLDYRLADSFSSKWTDRLVSDDLSWSGNMLDFYDASFRRIVPYLPKPFEVKGSSDIGGLAMEEALREALVNALSNYSPLLPGGLVIINSGSELRFRNTGRIKVGLGQAVSGGRSNPRNEGIMILFRHLGISDRAGTGIPKIFDIAKSYSLPTPFLTENDNPEETTLVISLVRQNANMQVKKITAVDVVSFLLVKGGKGATTNEIMSRFSLGRQSASKLLNEMLDSNVIATNGKATRGKAYFAK